MGAMKRRGFIAAAMVFPAAVWARRDWVSAVDTVALGGGIENDTAPLQDALGRHRGLFIPPGKTYLCDQLQLRPGNYLVGEGETSILKQNGVAGTGLLYANSGSATATIDDLAVSNLQLLGQVEQLGFSEWHHLAGLHGVRRVKFDRVTLRGFRGDGIYLGSGTSPGQERHNYEVSVVGSTFDGVNRDNRNGLSAIDVDGLLITDCRFLRCTRKNMPGPIDLEPNAHPWHVIRNVTIRRNRFEDNGGNLGEVGIVVPGKVRQSPRAVVVEENESAGYRGSGAFFAMVANGRHHAGSDVRVERNRDGRSGGQLPMRRITQPWR